MKTKNVSLSHSICGAAIAGAALFFAGPGAYAQNLFVGNYGTESIIEYSGGSQTTFATGLDYPTALAFDSSGDLFESDQFSGNIYEWAGGGSTRTTFESGLSQPSPMAINTAGDLFVAVGNNVDEFSSAGSLLNTLTGFDTPAGIAFDSAGNMYISNINGAGSGTGFITKITLGGVQSMFASGLNAPCGLAFNAAGDLFVAGSTYDTITEITPGGSKSQFASGLNNPNQMAFDKAGDMFVADWGVNNGNGDITEFAANGTESVFASGIRPTSLAFQGALPVPEPSLMGLCGTGAMAFLLFARGRKFASQLKQ